MLNLNSKYAFLIQEIINQLSPDLLLPEFKKDWTPQNPTQGFCSVASEALFFMIGGSANGWKAQNGRDNQGIVHWWLMHEEFGRLDPTADQYFLNNQTPPYLKARSGGFQGIRQEIGNAWGFDRKPSARAQKLLDKIIEHRWKLWIAFQKNDDANQKDSPYWWNIEGLNDKNVQNWLIEKSSPLLLKKYKNHLRLDEEFNTQKIHKKNKA